MANQNALSPAQQDQAAVLTEFLSRQQIARAFGVDDSTVTRALKINKNKKLRNSWIEKYARKFSDERALKDHFASKCQSVMDAIIDHISEEKLEKANLRDSAVAFGIFADKMALLRGINQTQDVRIAIMGDLRMSSKD